MLLKHKNYQKYALKMPIFLWNGLNHSHTIQIFWTFSKSKAFNIFFEDELLLLSVNDFN